MKTKQITGQQAWQELKEGNLVFIGNMMYFMLKDELYYQDEERVTKISNFNKFNVLQLKGWYIDTPSEYNLTIQQVMQKENVGKYYKLDLDDEVIFTVSYDNEDNSILELLIIDNEYDDSYLLAEDVYCLDFIVNSKYKEVEFKC